MKDRTLAIAPMECPREGEFQVQLREPGNIRGAAFALSKRLVALRGEAAFDENLVLFVEFTPEAPLRNRRFAILKPGRTMGEREGLATEFVAFAVSPHTGDVAFIYEVKELS